MQSFGSRKRGTRGPVVLAAAAALVVLALSACGGGSSSGTNGTTSSAPAQQGGTAYLAQGTQAAPNYIFPFASLQFFSTTNFQGFMNLMYRPLYWFGKGATPDLNLSLSLAGAPQYSNGGRTIKVTMKPYKWANGQTVTAQDVMFWMNMLKVEKLNWAGYAAGTIPDDLTSVTASGNTLTFKLNTAANSNWYTYNELSQITPMPLAWDITKTGQKPAALRNGLLPGGDHADAHHVEGHDGGAGLGSGEVVRGRLQLPHRVRRRSSRATRRTRCGRSSTARSS